MASIMIHLQTAHRLLQPGGLLFQRVRDPGQYYLGVTAPDSVNLDSFASKEIRWAAHLRAKTPKEWYQNIEEFYQKRRKKADPDFLLGYIFHNITDAAFDETLHNPIWAAAGRAYGSAMSVKDAGWEVSFRYDMSQREADWWKEVRPALAGARCRDFHTISGEQMGRHRDHLLTDYWDRPCQEPPKVITREMVWLLADYTEGPLAKILK